MTTASLASRFDRSVAVIIGIDKYENGIPPLRTAVNDARRLAAMLADLHNFEVRLFLDEDASHERLIDLLKTQLADELGPDDRLIFYFAGHGVALAGDDGPNGYLLPQDARRGEEDSYLFMPLVHDALLSLPIRHALIIMDSCFSGAFRWAATRDISDIPFVIHEERFDRFVKDPAWQVITSTAHDQKAMDQLSSGSLGMRLEEGGHSPFALALFEALEGKGDVVPADGGDGLITATELYLYLESRLQPETIDEGVRQTPGLWPLARHDKGEFVFSTPGRELDLPPAPPLNLDNNPYRGLESYDREHAELFFGREKVISDLENRIGTRALTIVLGASGTGKSSVVKAGLIPRLERRDGWLILPTVRPGSHPLLSLSRILDTDATADAIQAKIRALCEANPKTVLVIDQFEELITMTQSPEERESVLQLLHRLLRQHADRLDIVMTLRTDFAPQFSRGELSEYWDESSCVIPPMTQDDLRECILRPASARVMYFKPNELVEKLINEVVATPGGLPLLSFALSEMYIHYLGRGSDDRAIEGEDYNAVGGVVGALRSRANAEYEALPGDHKNTMRLIMLRMVSSSGGGMARRRVLRSGLNFDSQKRNEQVKTIVDKLVSARLLVMGNESSGKEGGEGEDYIEPAHDALVRAWGRLLRWVHKENEQDPGDLRFQHKLSADAEAWEQTEAKAMRKGLLWNDAARSASLRTLVNSGVEWLNSRERQFAERSVLANLRIRQGIAVGLMIVVVLAAAAVWQAVVAVAERDRAIARGAATAVQSRLVEGNLYRAVQIARRAAEHYPDAIAIDDAIRKIALHASPQLAVLKMPGHVRARFSHDDRWIIADHYPDQRQENTPRDVVAMDWIGNRTEITSAALTVTLSPGGEWLTSTHFAEDYGDQEPERVADCVFEYTANLFNISQVASGSEAGPRSFAVSDYIYPRIGDNDSAWVLACGTVIISGDIDGMPTESPWEPTGGFDTGRQVDAAFFDDRGRIVAVYEDMTRVYTRTGEMSFEVEGGDAVAAGGRIATVSARRVLVHDANGRRIAEFEGQSPVLSNDGRLLAYETSFRQSNTVVHLEPIEPPETYTLRNGNTASAPMNVDHFEVRGHTPRFSADGMLILTTTGGGEGPDSGTAESHVTDTRTGITLFKVAGGGGSFARTVPVVMTILGKTEIHVWDMRRFPTPDPLIWEGTRPNLHPDAFVALHPDGEHICDGYDPCKSADGSSEVSRSEGYDEFVVKRDPDAMLEPASIDSELIVEINCKYIESLDEVRFAHTEPWVLLPCENGIQLVDLNGNVLQSWDEDGLGEGAIFSDDERTVFGFRSNRWLWVHTPGKPPSSSFGLGPHDAFLEVADRHGLGIVAAASGRGTIQVYDTDKNVTHSMSVGVENSPIGKLWFSADGDALFARNFHGLMVRWNLSSDRELGMYDWVPRISDEDWMELTQ